MGQIILLPAAIECTNFIDTLAGDPQTIKIVVVPIRIKILDMESYICAYACNVQERCYFDDCIYARLKMKKEAEASDITPIAES